MQTLRWFFRVIWECIVPPKYKSVQRGDLVQDNDIIVLNLRRDCVSDGIHNWKYRRNSIIDMLNHYKPGVFCIQECMPHMWRFLKKHTKEHYSGVFIDAFSKKFSFFPFSEGIGIIYADYYKCFDKGYFKLSNKFGLQTKHWRVCQYVGLTNTHTGESFYVFNTHLDHKSRDARKESCTLIHQKVKEITKNHQTFIVGDFNAETYWDDNIRELAENYFYSVLPDTINCFGRYHIPVCIDYIFSKYDTKPHNYDMIQDNFKVPYLSDHNPLILQW